jgi:hypothetical protein
MSKDECRLAQRAIVAALVIATLGTAIAVHISSTQGLHERRASRLQAARHRVADALQRRTYFLEDRFYREDLSPRGHARLVASENPLGRAQHRTHYRRSGNLGVV